MDPSDVRPSPRRELQGPRPTPLKVNKESYRIKKPPGAGAAAEKHSHHREAAAPQPQRHRAGPVIIYSVSPKIIHIKPGDFMTLVQRLTGRDAPDDPASVAADISLASPNGALSLPPGIAAFEKVESSPKTSRAPDGDQAGIDVVHQWGIDGGIVLDRRATIPGILSPVSSALPPISPNLFPPTMSLDPNWLSIVYGLSPSSNNHFSTPIIPSPGTCWEFLSQFPDL